MGKNKKNKMIKQKTTKYMKKMRRRARSLGPSSLKDKILRDKPHLADRINPNPPDKEKMSEVIVDYARPLLDSAETVEEQKKAIGFAIICWNASFIEAEKRDAVISGAFAEGEEMLDSATREVMEFMVKRKEDLFPHNARIIQNWLIKDKGSQLYFEVASVPLK
jgi:hypothetical protein